NFWSVGGPGPCGPDSEMYWDWGEETGCGNDDCLPGCMRCERFLEFGNLVFMSYELHGDGTLTELPSKNIDTGWGLERVARVVQQVPSVYDTDGYQLIMEWVARQSGVAYGSSEDATKAHRVLADHGRGMAKFEEVAAKGEITAADVFELQTTDGFPIELTEELARERGLAFNDEEYTRLMEEHREKSRGGTGRYEPRFAGAPRTDFVGYEQVDVRTA